MKINIKNPPRKYQGGFNTSVEISDCGEIHAEANEQLTFHTESAKEYDITAKNWGFYATPSINGRLIDQGFKTALVKNCCDKYYIMLVDTNKLNEFHHYLLEDKQTLIEWLDERT